MITTSTDLRKYLTANNQVDISTIKPKLDQAERFVLEYVEKPLIDQLKVREAANTVTGEWIELQRTYDGFIAHWAVFKTMPELYAQLSDAGISSMSTETHERATKWSYEERKKSHFNSAYEYLEDMLKHIHANCMTTGQAFESYVSAEYKDKFKVLFKDSKDYNKVSYQKVNFFTFLQMASSQQEIINFYIEPLFGAAYLPLLLDNPTKTGTDKIVLDYIKRIVAAQMLSRNIALASIQIDAQGLRSIDIADDDSILGSALSLTEKSALRADIDEKINGYVRMLQHTIRINSGDMTDDIEDTPIYTEYAGKDVVRRENYNNAEAKGSFFF